MQKTFFISLIAILFLSFGCKDDDQPFSDCFKEPKKTQLNLQVLEGPTVSEPSKISIFFKITDANGNPAGFLTPDNFVIYEKGLNDECHRVISQFEAERKISGKEQVFNHTTLLVLDLSGSVLGQSLAELQEASIAFIQEIIPDTIDSSKSMGIFWFDGEDTLHELVPVTNDRSMLTAGIGGIFPGISTDNSTDFFGAVIKTSDKAKAVLAQFEDQDITSAVSVVLFTDGRDRANRYLREDAYNAVSSSGSDISFFTLGLGDEINGIDLETIGRNGSQLAVNVNQLTAIFRQIAQQVANEANSYYLFEYCSPIRNGNNNGLIIEAFEGNEVGYFEATFDATGFTGGCQL